uniref:creatininase family protein n=1 Tax=Nocardia cyriacigeorgica TaxID=135487 RepID=UPI002454B8E9
FMRRYDGVPHAGRTETAVKLALSPDRVRTEGAEAGYTWPLPHILPLLRWGGVRAVSANGVLGDPAGATAAEGAALLTDLIDQLTDQTRLWWPVTSPERTQP